MTRPLKFDCTDDQFHNLHVELDKVRKSSATVKVNKEALKNLLSDHAELQDFYQKNGGA